MFVKDFIVLSVDETDFFRPHFKINVFEFFGVSFFQKQTDTLVHEEIRLLDF